MNITAPFWSLKPCFCLILNPPWCCSNQYGIVYLCCNIVRDLKWQVFRDVFQ